MEQSSQEAKCIICGKRFRTKAFLFKHQLNKHPQFVLGDKIVVTTPITGEHQTNIF